MMMPSPPGRAGGVTQDQYAKPDIVAPAAHIVGPLVSQSSFATLCPACIIDARYFRVGGTSMASAIVAGIAADLLQAHPGWTLDQAKRGARHPHSPHARRRPRGSG
jgi:serine protease AprX